jgi:hypothetical protein
MWNLWETGELYTGFRWGDMMEEGKFGDLPVSVDCRIILKLIFIKRVGDLDWIDAAYGRDGQPSVEYAVMKLRVP